MSYLDKIISLDEKLKTQYGDDGKLSKTADRHVTNPGESKAEHRKDATEFVTKHKKRASDVTPQTGKIPGPKPATAKESIVYAMNRWAKHLAEAGRELGGVAKPYEGKKASDIRDPRVRSAAEKQKAKIDKKLGIKTNPDAGQLVQQGQEEKKKKRREGGAAGTPTEPSDIAKADAAESRRKEAGPNP